jgi:NAD(P)-dependent dehydrogenase (short-subunit alcohol dehydrogenase family)
MGQSTNTDPGRETDAGRGSNYERMNVASRALDRALDWTVAPGFSSVGIRLRERLWTERVEPGALYGRDVAVTGASSGIGEATCELLARAGARVHMVVRDAGRGEIARARVVRGLGHASPVAPSLLVHECDVSDLDSVRSLAAQLPRQAPALVGLIHNAGVLTQQRERSAQGHELTLATAVLGPFLLTRLLMAELVRGAPSRVVFVSSGGMYTSRLRVDDLELEGAPFDGPRFYSHAKRAQVILARQFAERFGGRGVGFHSMHPGWADTPGLERSLPRFHRLLRPFLRTPTEGADTAAWLVESSEPDRHPGAFWHDRCPRPDRRLPRTGERPEDEARLWQEVSEKTGLGDGANGDRQWLGTAAS